MAARSTGAARDPATDAAGSDLAASAARLVRALTVEPRPAGGAAESDARARCADELRRLGFAVREEPFECSELPGRWATPLGGVLSAAALGGVALLGRAGRPGVALAVLAATLALLGAGGAWLARHGVLALPLMRRRLVNLVAERGTPRVWLVAHLDSKSQPVPIGARAAGITLSALAWVAALALAVLQLAGRADGGAWGWLAALGAAAALPVAASVVGARSAGAVDNASGCAAVLTTAALLPGQVEVGVLLTSAEELGLAGARAWVRGRAPGTAVNFDGLDDRGALVAAYTGRRPAGLARALERGGLAAGERVAARRLLPGVLTDGVALADAGWQVVTLMRGTLATLARVHTPADTADRLRGDGIALAARIAAHAVARLGAAAHEPANPRRDH